MAKRAAFLATAKLNLTDAFSAPIGLCMNTRTDQSQRECAFAIRAMFKGASIPIICGLALAAKTTATNWQRAEGICLMADTITEQNLPRTTFAPLRPR